MPLLQFQEEEDEDEDDEQLDDIDEEEEDGEEGEPDDDEVRIGQEWAVFFSVSLGLDMGPKTSCQKSTRSKNDLETAHGRQRS